MTNVMNHLGQCVTDLERSRTFYEQALGFEFWRILELDDEPSNQLLRLDSRRSGSVPATCGRDRSCSSCCTSRATARRRRRTGRAR